MKETGHIYSVTEINLLLKDLFDNSPILQRITIKGEISNFKIYPKAWYFTLKDHECQLNATMFFYYRSPLDFIPKDGDEVLATGSLTIYEKRGQYQLMVSDMAQYGLGLQLIKLQELKKKLDKEGLFDSSRKRPIVKYPKLIGLIAGNDSAAQKDVISNIQRRYPLVNLYFFPALVQGLQAPKDIIRALNKAYTYPLDTLIIARGGGSEEDLSAFNDEEVVRHIATSPIPTIGAIGHEINTTLADLVCDLRASTPTGAAELATKDKVDIMQEIEMIQKHLIDAITSKLTLSRQLFTSIKEKPYFKSPQAILDKTQIDIDLLKQRLKGSMSDVISSHKQIVNRYKLSLISPNARVLEYKVNSNNLKVRLSKSLINNLDMYNVSVSSIKKQFNALSPYNVLERGYSIVTNIDDQVISDIKQVEIEETINITLKSGKLISVIKERK